jgi:hypothetical protein
VLWYNFGMAAADETESSPTRGCGPLSPLFDEALAWAAGLHRDQARKNTKVPYIAHLVAVSSLVLEDGGTETEAIAGLFHDATEDCGVQVEPILRQRFGDRAISDVISERLPKSRTGAELVKAVMELYAQTYGVEQPGEVPPLVPACTNDPQCKGAAKVPATA